MLSPANMRGSVAVFLCLCVAIAKEAYVYGYPMVDGDRISYAFYLLPGNPPSEALQFLFWGERSNDLLKARIAAEWIPEWVQLQVAVA